MTNHALNLAKNGDFNVTSQQEFIPGREDDMEVNSAGGVSFKVDDWGRLDRFLMLGTTSGSYYASEQKLTIDNAKAVQRAIDNDGLRAVNRIVEISHSGRAPKNDPALFALAIAASAKDGATRKAALDALPKVARIGTHLFHFAAYVKNFRGYGRALRRAIANWYLNQPVDRLANQAIKYQQRDGWSNRDMLRLSHPKTKDGVRNNIFRWIVKGDELGMPYHAKISAFEEAKRADNKADIVSLIRENDLPREAVPTQFLNEADVWEALLEKMPMTAMIRNLAKMTTVGLLDPLSAGSNKVLDQLNNEEAICKARVHPFNILVALMVYKGGKGLRGNLTWTPNPQIIDALDSAFYLAFGSVIPSNTNHLIALDVSGSMGWQDMMGVPGLTPRVVAGAMSLVTVATEKNCVVTAFAHSGASWQSRIQEDGIRVIDITPKMRLDTVLAKLDSLPMGGTDCALPALFALKKKMPIESFSIWTDSETWAGDIQPSQALNKFRKNVMPDARQAVVAMTSNGFTIADPLDSGQLDVVGLDSAVPQLLSNFFRGEI